MTQICFWTLTDGGPCWTEVKVISDNMPWKYPTWACLQGPKGDFCWVFISVLWSFSGHSGVESGQSEWHWPQSAMWSKWDGQADREPSLLWHTITSLYVLITSNIQLINYFSVTICLWPLSSLPTSLSEWYEWTMSSGISHLLASLCLLLHTSTLKHLSTMQIFTSRVKAIMLTASDCLHSNGHSLSFMAFPFISFAQNRTEFLEDIFHCSFYTIQTIVSIHFAFSCKIKMYKIQMLSTHVDYTCTQNGKTSGYLEKQPSIADFGILTPPPSHANSYSTWSVGLQSNWCWLYLDCVDDVCSADPAANPTSRFMWLTVLL